MPQKLVRDSDRGWYGWESRYNSLLRMSNRSLDSTRIKIKLEQFRHSSDLQRIHLEEKERATQTVKDLRTVKEEYIKMRAYEDVYKVYSFRNFDPFHRSKRRRILQNRKNGEVVLYDQKRKEPSHHNICNKQTPAFRVKNMGRSNVGDNGQTGISNGYPSSSYARHNFENVTKEIVGTSKEKKILQTWMSKIPAREIFHDKKITNKRELKPERCPQPRSDKIATIAPERYRHEESQKATTLSDDYGIFHPPKAKQTSLYTTSFAMKKHIEIEVISTIHYWSPSERRKRTVAKILRQIQLPELIQRSKTTSAIFRDFKTVKNNYETCE